MKRLRPLITAGLVLAVAATLAWDGGAPETVGQCTAQISLSGIGFRGQDLPLNEAERSVFASATAIKRLYETGCGQWLVLIVDSSGNRHAIHDPAYCFRGAGWTVTEVQPVPIPGGSATLLRLLRAQEKREILYWISDGRTRHTSQLRAWYASAWRRMTRGRSGRAPILVVIQPAGPRPVAWDQLTERLPELFAL